MKLRNLVEVSQRVAATSSRRAKIHALDDVLRRVPPDQIEVAVALLSGSARQGRIGIGWSAIRDARQQPPATRRRSSYRTDKAVAEADTLDTVRRIQEGWRK